MKIKDIQPQPSILPLSKKAAEPKCGQAEFQQYLTEARANRCAHLPSGMGVLPSQGLSAAAELNELRCEGIAAAENTLRLLEDYQNAMGNPRVPLRQIDSIVQSLSREVKTLDGLSRKIPSTDPLVKILGDVGIVSTVEIEKFNRGEYV